MTAPTHLVDGIMAVMQAAFDPAYGEAWNRRQVADALALPNTHAILVDEECERIEHRDHRTPAAFVLTRQGANEEELLLIAVDPGCRRRGIAKQLILRLFDAARARSTEKIFLEMRRGNPAEHLYRASGFEPIGLRPNYYRMTDGRQIDAITFGRMI